MSTTTTLIELFAETGEAKLVLRREADLYAIAVLAFPAGRHLVVIERTYRDGIHVILDPTQDELDIARDGDLQRLWSSERASFLASALHHETGLFSE